LNKIILSSDDIAESAAVLHTFDFVISIIHYKRLIKNKTFAWDLIKARYVNDSYTIGSKTSFTVNWRNGGIFNENSEKDNKAVINQINKDDKTGTFDDDKPDDTNNIKAHIFNPPKSIDLVKITGAAEFEV
jgi:hypothetical protein